MRRQGRRIPLRAIAAGAMLAVGAACWLPTEPADSRVTLALVSVEGTLIGPSFNLFTLCPIHDPATGAQFHFLGDTIILFSDGGAEWRTHQHSRFPDDSPTANGVRDFYFDTTWAYRYELQRSGFALRRGSYRTMLRVTDDGAFVMDGFCGVHRFERVPRE